MLYSKIRWHRWWEWSLLPTPQTLGVVREVVPEAVLEAALEVVERGVNLRVLRCDLDGLHVARSQES